MIKSSFFFDKMLFRIIISMEIILYLILGKGANGREKKTMFLLFLLLCLLSSCLPSFIVL